MPTRAPHAFNHELAQLICQRLQLLLGQLAHIGGKVNTLKQYSHAMNPEAA